MNVSFKTHVIYFSTIKSKVISRKEVYLFTLNNPFAVVTYVNIYAISFYFWYQKVQIVFLGYRKWVEKTIHYLDTGIFLKKIIIKQYDIYKKQKS